MTTTAAATARISPAATRRTMAERRVAAAAEGCSAGCSVSPFSWSSLPSLSMLLAPPAAVQPYFNHMDLCVALYMLSISYYSCTSIVMCITQEHCTSIPYISLEQGFDLPLIFGCHFVPSYFHGGCHQTIVNCEWLISNHDRADTERAMCGPDSQLII